ncbi:tetraspanin-18B-like [Mytilus edulis]|uniref:tetraspanin-18B-like n=1 Tax=Mytilus edulis TaxID=6550 RepID=UPI0039F0C292
MADFILKSAQYQRLVNKLIFKHFVKSLDESYKGFRSNDPVSIGWNVFMQQFNCCGIHGYEDFTSSHSFIEKWAEPRHSVIKYYAINFPLACCNSIEITHAFQGPCREDNYIDKRGCKDVFWETADTYQTSVVTLVAIACLIQLSQIIVTCYTRIIKPNKPSNEKTDQMDTKNYSNFPPSKKDIKHGSINPVYSEEEMWYPEVQKNNYVSPQKQAWDTGNGDGILEEEDKWYSEARRKPMKRPNRSLVMDF